MQIDGGRAIYADGAITLCDRADRTPGRGFDGRLAQLAIYDAALTESNVCHMLMSCINTCAEAYAQIF